MKRARLSFLVLVICSVASAFVIFNCGGSAPDVPISINSVKLVRLDGTELDLTAIPVPRKVSVKCTLSEALNEKTDRDLFESAVKLNDPDGKAIAGTYSWATDNSFVTFTPTRRLDYQTQYKIAVANDSLPIAKAITDSLTFKTMTMGDVNGDGYADVFVGANYMPGGCKSGGAYIFHGSASGIANKDLSTTSADTTIDTANADSLGYSVAINGDVNADGYADVVVGAPSANGGGTQRGQAHILFGSAVGIANCKVSSTPACSKASIAGDTDNSSFGYSVGFAGDVNGDGYDDVIVGAYNYEEPVGDYNGRTYIFFGGTTLTGALTAGSAANVKIWGDKDKDYFGYSVATAGDVNGDGYDDVIIGAPGNNPYYASIFHGGPTLVGNLTPAANASTILKGDSNFDQFGNSVNTAGDINKDGYADVIVGAPKAEAFDKGITYLFLGSNSGVANCDIATSTSCIHATLSGAANTDFLGKSVAPAGDVNRDGYDDIIIGADHNKPGGIGYAYIFLGSTSGIGSCDISTNPTCPAASFKGEAANDFLGQSVNTAGDINGDGFDDIIIAAPLADGGGTNRGRAYIFLGKNDGIKNCDLSTGCTADTTITGKENNDQLGGNVR